jgi:hypothetical protein
MGSGICKAVEDVFPGVHDFVCHFHFLRDLGKDFLEPAYREIRNRLRSHAASSKLHSLVKESKQRILKQIVDPAPLAKAIINGDLHQDLQLLPVVSAYCLALWALQGKHNADGYGFPFDLPLLVFAQRLLELSHGLSGLTQQLPSGLRGDNRLLLKLVREVWNIAKDPELNQAVEELRWRTQAFDKLRKVMRIAIPGGTKGLNDDGTTTAISTIRQGVEKFRNEIATDTELANDPLSVKMIKQIDKYDKKLFADPIVVDTPEGKVTVYPQRTNNIIEQFFRALRRGHRKKSGNNSMSRTLQTMLADTPLIKNLENPRYMEILLDGRSSLEDLFGDFGEITFSKLIKSEADTDRILPGFRAVTNMKDLPKNVVRILETHYQM